MHIIATIWGYGSWGDKMSNRIAIWCLAVAVLFVGIGFLASPTLADPMEVKVLDGLTAVEGAKVTVKDQNGKEVASGTTKKPDGTQRAPRVTFDLPPGTYTVEATYTDATGTKKKGEEKDIQHLKKTEVGVFVDPATTSARTGWTGTVRAPPAVEAAASRAGESGDRVQTDVRE